MTRNSNPESDAINRHPFAYVITRFGSIALVSAGLIAGCNNISSIPNKDNQLQVIMVDKINSEQEPQEAILEIGELMPETPLPSAEDPAQNTDEAQEEVNDKVEFEMKNALYIGDSVAVGLNQVITGEYEVKDRLKVGASPSLVLSFINKQQDLSGKEIVLSTGILNNPAQAYMIKDQLLALQQLGALRVMLAGAPNTPEYKELNKTITNKVHEINETWPDFALFMGKYQPGSDGVHPHNYLSYSKAIS